MLPSSSARSSCWLLTNSSTTFKPCDHSDGKTQANYGVHRFTKEDSWKTLTIPIIDVKVPQFSEGKIAIQVLKSPLTYSQHTRPICLPDPGEKFYGRSVKAVGWVQTRKYSHKKRFQAKTVDLKVSKKRYNNTKLIRTVLYKKKGEENQDPCTGDSGIRLFNSVDRTHICLLLWLCL